MLIRIKLSLDQKRGSQMKGRIGISDVYMNYGLMLYLKLARVDVGNVIKKGENMEGIIT